MSKWLAMAEALEKNSTPCDSLTELDKTQPQRENGGFVTFCQLSHEEEEKLRTPDLDAFDERAAIIEFDAGLSRDRAEDMAAKAQGYGNVVEFRAAVQSMKKDKT